MESFLKEKAVMLEKKDLSRTYILVRPGSGNILGYYSLGMKCVRIPDDSELKERIRNKMNVDPDTNVAQSYLLGQLCRSEESMPGLGASMINDALDIFREIKERIGCRLVRIDCDPNIREYYEERGFVYIGTNRNKNLCQMVIYI